MDINNRICQRVNDSLMSTGKKPKKIYLGRNEMLELLRWAAENQYISAIDRLNIEGDRRPEVQGLLCWEVNDDNHLECV